MTSDGEFEAVGRSVEQCVEKIEGTPYLSPGVARFFLEELAHGYAVRGARAMSVAKVANARQLIWSPGMTEPDRRAAILALITGSGIATVEQDEFRFVSTTVYHYLLAKHIVRRRSHGPGRWVIWTSKHLRPKPVWSEQAAEFQRFLVIMWWPTARTAVARQLAKFLKEPHRYPNILFVADLCRRGWLSGSGLCERTNAILREEVRTARRAEQEWREMAESLRAFDPAAANAELEQVVRSPMPGTTLHRQFAAVLQLVTHQPALGTANLVYLSEHLWGEPDDRLAVALRIAEVDRDVGNAALERLAKDPSIGHLRAEAALHVDAPPLWRALLEDRTMPDSGRERLLAKLLDRDPDGTLALVPAFVASLGEERTRLRVARLIKDHDPSVAWELAYDSTWTTERQIPSPVRLDGVLLLGMLDPAQELSLLDRFSTWSEVDGEIRVQAAIIHMERSGSPAALVNAAGAEDITPAHRAEAAKALGRPYPALGAEAYIALAATCKPSDKARLDFLRAAYALAPEPATEALAQVALDKRFPDRIRVDAVDIARRTLTTSRRLDLYSTIAKTARTNDVAIAVARKVKAMNGDVGERLMAALTKRNMSSEEKLQLAEEAGRHGKPVLLEFAHRSRPANERFRAAVALSRIVPKMSDTIFKELANTRGCGEVRVKAVLELPKSKVPHLLATIVHDHRENEKIRYLAGRTALELDYDDGQRLLTALAHSRVSRRMQNQITRLLSR